MYWITGDIDFFENLLLEGYDHIADIIDTDESTILQVAQARGHDNVVKFLEDVAEFEVHYNMLKLINYWILWIKQFLF